VADLEKVAERRGWTSDFTLELKRIFGTRPHGTSHDLRWLASRAMAAGNLPELLLDCGTGDFLLEDNREIHRDFTREGVPHTYREFPGEHNWDDWDEHIRELLVCHSKSLGVGGELEAKSGSVDAVALVRRGLGGAGKPPLVVLHGLLGSSRAGRTTGKDLADAFRVFAPDLRNH